MVSIILKFHAIPLPFHETKVTVIQKSRLKFTDAKHLKLHHSTKGQSNTPRRWFTNRSSYGRVDYYNQAGFVDRPRRNDCTAGQMDGEAGWWTTSGNIGPPPPTSKGHGSG